MKSDAVTKGMQQAPHRSLFNALGMTEEELNELMDPRLYTGRCEAQVEAFLAAHPE